VINLISCFPEGFTPQPHQTDILDKLSNALNGDKKFIILQAPTGSGKTFIAKTLGNAAKPVSPKFKELVNNYSAFKTDGEGGFVKSEEILNEPAGGSFALTITKTLQDQYNFTFKDADVLKGKSNYVCELDKTFSVETAPCTLVHRLRDDCWGTNTCTYYNARNAALTSQFSVLNYKMFLSLPDHVKHRDIIICDEASELEEEFVKNFTCELQYDRLKFNGVECKPLATDINENVRIWLSEVNDKVTSRVTSLAESFKKDPRKASIVDRNRLQYLKNVAGSIDLVLSHWSKCEFVTEIDAKRAVLTPLHISALTHHVFDYADKVVLMSATIIDPVSFARTLGIKEYEYIEIESTFDPKKSPIYVCTKFPVNYKNKASMMPKIAALAKELCDQHKDDKGIIHTHTLENVEILKRTLGLSPRFLYRDSESNNEEILERHFEDIDPTVLVSPSLAFGTDLKDHLARFQIIVKLMYPSLGSKRIKRLCELDRDWYINKMLNSLVQACGRATRSKDDHSKTYILDGSIKQILDQHKKKLPKAFIDRFV